MNETKTFVRFFTIADFEEEESWLRAQSKSGWRLMRMVPPCFYVFERCSPEDVIYRLDFTNNGEESGYFQLFRDYGWEYIGRCLGWLYFRKPASDLDGEQDAEIFSDDRSKLDMVRRVIKTRLLPLTLIFFACVLPNFARSAAMSDPFSVSLTVIFAALTLLYLGLIVHCSVKLRRLRKKYGEAQA